MNDDRTRIAIRGSAVSIGAELNQTYRIDALLGVGGMGEVYKGHNIQTGDPVAIKIVLPEFAGDETILGLFRKEARILNHLYHEAIVRYYVFSFDPVLSRPYLAMEYVDGPSLAAHVKNAPLAPSEFMPLLRRLADGLHRAHLAGVIHRDMSPDNVILPGGLVQNAKIIDFGIARSANVGGETLLGGSFAGKYNFVSPEQLGLYGGEVTPKSDIYSLALVMVAAMRGRPLDMTGSQLDIIEKRRSLPDLDGVPRQFHAVLAAMLAPDPAKRPDDMAAIRDWPDAQAAPPAKAGKANKPKALVARTAETPQARPSHALRNAVFAIAVIAVIGLGALGGWVYTNGGLFSRDGTPIGGQTDNKPPDGNNQEGLSDRDKAIREAERRDRLAAQLSAAGQDAAALQRFLDQCGADCPADLAQQARDRIKSVKDEAARREGLAAQLSAAGQDAAALQRFLDQCGADCPADLAQQARDRIKSVKDEASRREGLAAQLSAAGQDAAALQHFLDQCGADCPADLAQQARDRIKSVKDEAARREGLAAQLSAAGEDAAALQRFLDQCGADCPADLAQQARDRLKDAREQATRRNRLAAQLAAAGKDATALKRFVDQCGADCPQDLAAKAKAALDGVKLAAVTSPTPAVLRDFVASFGADSCFAATADNVTASSATVTALGTATADQSFADAFKQKAGFTPTVKLDAVSDQQCGFVGALRRMSIAGAPPLKIVLSKSEIRGADKDTLGDPLTVTVTGAGERNIYLFVMDHEGGIQNLNRTCRDCITIKAGEMKASLSLSKPDKVDGVARPAFFPTLVFAVASSRPLISINTQDAFAPDDFIEPFLKEIATARDVTTVAGYFKLRDQ
ncbi:protein kinase [Labrys sp. KNU-23]|uniref:protein kinase domain-containing protein n=1 Tax=Labrys sp. KNU-23 TaxID=2789216 RepID=UPI001FF00864|nr:protein kinase [Labrys sp. KNU-23]